MLRRTKIIATLGPATDAPDVLRRMIQAGMNLVRVNMSHGQAIEQAKRITLTREIAKSLNKEVGVLVDLQGPKIRVSKFKTDKVTLVMGQTFTLDAGLDADAGSNTEVGIDYKALSKDVSAGDRLLLDDGRILLEVKQVKGKKIICHVLLGGELSNHKGINRYGGGLSAESLTEKDKKDILFAAEHDVDYVALSFPRSKNDILRARYLLEKAGSTAGIVAKIERVEAVEALDDIIQVSDGVMVARGDLGVETGFAELPGIQKRIIQRARALDTAVITATQMMESMVTSPIPTRAEVSDVANAVIDGTDAVMLSAETATGQYPVEVIEHMSQVCLAAERQRIDLAQPAQLERDFNRIDETIAFATMFAANHLQVKAIVALTETGSTPLWMSRVRSGIPIYGVSRSKKARGRMTLFRGVYPVEFDVTQFERWKVIREVLTVLRNNGMVQPGEKVILTRGDVTGISGGANAIKIVEVEPGE